MADESDSGRSSLGRLETRGEAPSTRAVFIADVHLKRLADPAYESCMRFFSRLEGRGSASAGAGHAAVAIDLLVICGDFFDFWFERRGQVYPEFRPVVESLIRLGQQGVRVCLCEGNHDFFLGDFFAHQRGFEVYPDEFRLDLDGLNCLVSHGDLVDDRNWRYQILRRWLRSAPVYRMQRILPLSLLWQVARLSSRVSRDAFAEGTNRLMTVFQRYGDEKWREGFDAVIFGHCHTPSFREERIDGRERYLITLGDWVTYRNYLLYDQGRFTLERFEPEARHEISL